MTILTTTHIRGLENRLKRHRAYTDIDLVSRVSQACFQWLTTNYPDTRAWRVVCGQGFNACDGLQIACYATLSGLSVELVVMTDWSKHENPVMRQLWQQCLDVGLKPNVYHTDYQHSSCDLIIDALLGIGFQGRLTQPYVVMIQQLLPADSTCPITAIDVPSGLEADTGAYDQLGVKATDTLTIFSKKPGLLGYYGRQAAGDVHVLLANELEPFLTDEEQPLQYHSAPSFSQARSMTSHKNLFGRIVFIGSFYGYPGAISLAAKAAARMGCGSIQIITHQGSNAAILRAYPSFILTDIMDQERVLSALDDCDTIVIGPGLEPCDMTLMALKLVLKTHKCCIIDAGCLRMLGAVESLLHSRCIYTPHPGEAAAMLGTSDSIKVVHRLNAMSKLTERYPGVCVLKGCMTLIGQSNQQTWLSPYGHHAMSVAGMGDLLTGIIAMFVSHNRDVGQLISWVSEAVSYHGVVGENAMKQHGIGLMPEDMLNHLILKQVGSS